MIANVVTLGKPGSILKIMKNVLVNPSNTLMLIILLFVIFPAPPKSIFTGKYTTSDTITPAITPIMAVGDSGETNTGIFENKCCVDVTTTSTNKNNAMECALSRVDPFDTDRGGCSSGIMLFL